MTGGTWRWWARGVDWWIRRNPMYLLSAVAMALGARWYLVTPDAPAGEVGRILLTLGVLQAYELAVAAVLILLHRRRKSPEDQPSLLLVAALFWTGPMAATMEMTARHGEAGVGFAAAACLIALMELQAIRRTIGLVLSWWSQVAVSACVVLLAGAPVRLRLPHAAAGTDEVALHLFWWLLGGIVLLASGALAWHSKRDRASLNRAPSHALRVELVFLAVVFAASAAHLWAMNYAFFGNARAFYASPLLVALAVVLFEYIARAEIRSRLLWGLGALLPAAAIALTTEGFDENVPVQRLPFCLRNPLAAVLAITGIAWWFGCVRGGPPLLLHGGSVALVAAVIRMIGAPMTLPTGFDTLRLIVPVGRDEAGLIIYAAAVYLLAIAWLRRSRVEVLAALGMHLAGFALLIWGRTRADLMAIYLLGGWSALVALHVVLIRPRWQATIWPVGFLIAATATFGFQPDLAWPAYGHAAGMVAVLMLVGTVWPWTRYRTLGSISGGAFLTLAIGRGVTHGTHPKAAIAVLSAFLLLAAGTALSWYKRRLLQLTARSEHDNGSERPVSNANS